jgi:photosystem II stability/assembly factor-like uncharacterized protein
MKFEWNSTGRWTARGLMAAGALICLGAGVVEFWDERPTGGTASLRGLSAVDARIAWTGGTGGTLLRSEDGGSTWAALAIGGAEKLDFRAIAAFDAKSAVVLSAGPGKASRVYRTADGGAHWGLALQNADESGFFDALAFWDRQRGLLLGDPVNGHFVVMKTEDGGASWQRVPAAGMPAANPDEGAFAASGSCLVTGPGGRAWFGTGGTRGARVFRSEDWGRTWTVAETPLLHDAASAGIFSLAFRDARHGVAVGGDYLKLAGAVNNVAITEDGGVTWSAPGGPGPSGFRSAVAFVRGSSGGSGTTVATGPGGTDVSLDGGRTWKRVSERGYHALSFTRDGAGWASGDKGRTGRMK